MSWRKTIRTEPEASTSSWRDTITSQPETVSEAEGALRGLEQGITGGWSDEIQAALEAAGQAVGVKNLGSNSILDTELQSPVGLDLEKLKEVYAQRRDAQRKELARAQEQNPWAYGLGQAGGSVAASFVPGLNVSKGATLAARAGTAAATGAIAGAGMSEAEDVTGVAQDAAIGGALGLGSQVVSEKVLAPLAKGATNVAGKVVRGANERLADTVNKVSAKGARLFAGVDEDAALRQATRPLETAAAEADDYAFKLGQRAVAETEAKGRELGQAVGAAKDAFLESSGSQIFPQTITLRDQVDDFLLANRDSTRGFSALSKTDRNNLVKLRNMLDGPLNGEDLVKVRDYLDHVKRLATKYDQQETGPVVNFLKGLRGNADGILDKAAPDVDLANQAFGQFKDDTSLLRGATNAGQAESMISNLYGANKGMQQEAASRLLSPETFEGAKDIAANKAFGAAARPGGDNYFRRGALGVLTLGTSEVATNPEAWKQGMRNMGRLQQSIESNPQVFGKYAQALADAVSRGPQSLAATHFILSQRDPEYRRTLQDAGVEDKK